jgi:hypothetical protein
LPVLPLPHHSNVRHDVAIAGTIKLLHGPPGTKTFAKLEREIEVTSVAQLGSSFLITKFQDQVTSATVDRLNRATRFLNLNLLSEFEFNQALARS